jgi:hypothetical protein
MLDIRTVLFQTLGQDRFFVPTALPLPHHVPNALCPLC